MNWKKTLLIMVSSLFVYAQFFSLCYTSSIVATASTVDDIDPEEVVIVDPFLGSNTSSVKVISSYIDCVITNIHKHLNQSNYICSKLGSIKQPCVAKQENNLWLQKNSLLL